MSLALSTCVHLHIRRSLVITTKPAQFSVEPFVLHELSGLGYDKTNEEDCQSKAPGCSGKYFPVVVLCGIRIGISSRLSALSPSGHGWHRTCQCHPSGQSGCFQGA